MSSHDSRSEVFEDIGTFGDPDLTPKPLQVVKQRTLGCSDPAKIHQLPSLPNAQSQQTFTPIRRSSVRFDRTLLDLSQQDPAAPTSQWARRNAFLHVNKQRRSDPGCTNSAAYSNGSDAMIGLGLSSSSQGPSDFSKIIVTGALGGHAYARRAGAEATHAGTRAATIGIFTKTDVQSPTNDQQPICLAPTPLIRSRYRAATANGAVMESGKDTLKDTLLKPSSTRPHLISRVMSGLTNRAHTSHALSRKDQQTMQEHHRDADASNRQNSKGSNAGRSSFSSIGTDDYGGSQLESALTAFPTPPTTAGPSPTIAGLGACSRSLSQQYRRLCKPESAGTNGIQLTLTAEHDQLCPENGKTMFVAVDVEAIVNTAISGQSLWSQHTGLDVVVIIDNSLYTSPNTLMSSCEIARFLASVLNIVTDRIAVFCTSNFGDQDTKLTTVWPLTQIKASKLKIALDKIVSSTERMNEESWTLAIDSAKESLLQSEVPDQDTEVLQDTFGHIFILTPSTTSIPAESLVDDRLNVHIICPAIVPQTTKITTNGGWRLRSLSTTEPRAVNASRDTDPKSLFNKIRCLIAHARGGSLPGKLRDVALDIVAGPDCSIEGVMGKCEWSSLLPGDMHTVLVKLRIRSPKASECSFQEVNPHSGALMSSDNVLSELDEMLGLSTRNILTATLRYRHSLLPKNTTCSVMAKCLLQRQPMPSEESESTVRNPFPRSACGILVQKRLAYQLATQGSPRNALSRVRREFGETGLRSLCTEYISLIIKELNFQSRIIERLEIDASSKKPRSNTLPSEPGSPFEHFDQGILQATHYRPDEWITDAIDEGVSTDEQVQLAVLSNGKLKDKRPPKWLYSEPNQAKVIWNDLQRASKPLSKTNPKKASNPRNLAGLGQGRRAASSSAEQDRQRRVRELDGWVKESVRTNTLRSVGSFVERKAKEAGAARW